MKRTTLLLAILVPWIFAACAGDPDARFLKKIQSVEDEYKPLLSEAKGRADRNRIQTRYREELGEVLSEAKPGKLCDGSRVVYAGILMKLDRAEEASRFLRPLVAAQNLELRVSALSGLIHADAMQGKADAVRESVSALESVVDGELQDYAPLLLRAGNLLRDKDLELSLGLIDRGLSYPIPTMADGELNTAIHIRFVDGGLGNMERGVFLERMRRMYGDRERIRMQIEKKRGFLDFLGAPAPELDQPGRWLNRRDPLRLADLRGRYVLIDFFAPWCPDCRNSLPGFLQLGREAGASRLTLVMVTKTYGFYADEETRPVRNLKPPQEIKMLEGYLKRTGLELPVFVASDDETHSRFNASAIPHYVLIAPDGTVADLCMERVHGFFKRVERRISAHE